MLSANKRIAKNTIVMYIRLITAMVVGLYTSRLVLSILGVSDYGLFAVVGGILALFTFISSSLATATSRFFNVEMGRGEDGDVNASFNINRTLHFVLALIIFVLAETVGLWYVLHHLNVASNKMSDAVFVYQVSIITACLGIINNPYQSLITAHERFLLLSVVEIFNIFVRLGCILLLSLYHGMYALRLYSIIFSLTIVNSFVIYHWVAHHNWPEIVRGRLIKQWARYREVLNFGGWNVLATLAYTARSSGSDLLLNSFFGTAMNGAFAISRTINDSLIAFTGNFDSTSAPQIIQAYAAGEKPRYTSLCNKIGRINLLLFEWIAFPLLIELDLVLHLWLGHVPTHTFEFCVLYIIICGLALTCGGIFNIINASGRIKWFKLNNCITSLLCLPIGYALLKVGAAPYTILVLFGIAEVIQRIIQLALIQRIIHYDAWRYAKEAYTRPAIIALIYIAIYYVCSLLPIHSTIEKLTTILACFIIVSSLIAFIGLRTDERQKLIAFIKRKTS